MTIGELKRFAEKAKLPDDTQIYSYDTEYKRITNAEVEEIKDFCGWDQTLENDYKVVEKRLFIW